MKRRNRDLVLFNLSALDVLATAAGVFVLLAVLMMPYFRKSLDAYNSCSAGDNFSPNGVWDQILADMKTKSGG